jgi:hypothetical protein
VADREQYCKTLPELEAAGVIGGPAKLASLAHVKTPNRAGDHILLAKSTLGLQGLNTFVWLCRGGHYERM